MLQKPCRLDITDRPNSFSTRTPSAFIAMSASPATAPSTRRTTHSTTSDVGSAGRTRHAQNGMIVAVTKRAEREAVRETAREGHGEQGADPRHEQRDREMANADTDVRRDPRNAGREAAGDASVHREHRRRRASRTPYGRSGWGRTRCGRRGRDHRPRLSRAGRAARAWPDTGTAACAGCHPAKWGVVSADDAARRRAGGGRARHRDVRNDSSRTRDSSSMTSAAARGCVSASRYPLSGPPSSVSRRVASLRSPLGSETTTMASQPPGPSAGLIDQQSGGQPSVWMAGRR